MTDSATESDFSDWEPADSYVPDNIPDPYQVARRIREVSDWLAQMDGNDTARDREILAFEVDIAAVFIKHLLERGRDGSALALHEARVERDRMPDWRDLSDEEKRLALALADDLVRWLIIEGTVIR